MPSPTYVALAKTVLTGTSTLVDITSIPQTYTDLLLVVSARSNFAANYDWMAVYYNTASGLNYSNRYMYGNSSTVSTGSGSTPNEFFRGIPAANATANTFSNSELYISNYTSSNNKPASLTTVTENNASTANSANIVLSANLWSSSSAITALKIYSGDGSFVSGSRFDLYGIKNS